MSQTNMSNHHLDLRCPLCPWCLRRLKMFIKSSLPTVLLPNMATRAKVCCTSSISLASMGPFTSLARWTRGEFAVVTGPRLDEEAKVYQTNGALDPKPSGTVAESACSFANQDLFFLRLHIWITWALYALYAFCMALDSPPHGSRLVRSRVHTWT